jgi:hypothetical protein
MGKCEYKQVVDKITKKLRRCKKTVPDGQKRCSSEGHKEPSDPIAPAVNSDPYSTAPNVNNTPAQILPAVATGVRFAGLSQLEQKDGNVLSGVTRGVNSTSRSDYK